MRPRTPLTFIPNLYGSLLNSGEDGLTRPDIVQEGLAHGLNQYKAKAQLEALVENGVLRRWGSGYRLTPRYEARRRRK